jgi:hypothetical protein
MPESNREEIKKKAKTFFEALFCLNGNIFITAGR